MSIMYCEECQELVDTDYDDTHNEHVQEFEDAYKQWEKDTDNPGYLPAETYEEAYGDF